MTMCADRRSRLVVFITRSDREGTNASTRLRFGLSLIHSIYANPAASADSLTFDQSPERQHRIHGIEPFFPNQSKIH